MKIATENISTEDTSQASFPPFTRGYEAIPYQLHIDERRTIDDLETLHSFSTSDIVAILKSFQQQKNIDLLLSTPILDIEFVAGVRALRTLVSMLDKDSESLTTRKINFFIEIAHSDDAAQELLFAQFAQTNTILCDEKDMEALKLLLNHLPTLPIDTLFGSENLDKITNRIVEEVYKSLNT